ncbi:hypothetical protein CFH99_09560 [Nocardioides aromaticivorans]|uniref:SWIM-type domain-containing protein n=1 Tax=Nocardioides aromaticivorans TaxID=200618 RepID=A0ABX7PJ35_9ACTN|nr:hypothetical protein [Nocardioides aromaticivorans]QSR25869.1 hypothetical protein CFH99_09560 [Nocardioides aromaticivorans]
MTLLASLRPLLQRWDDDAWAGLANRGLLRRARKDLASAPPTSVSDGVEVVEVVVGGQVVRFGPEGPASARCSCPAGTVCQHVIAAGLWLAALPEAETGEPTLDLHAELMAITTDVLQRHAGRPGYRWAVAMVGDLDLEDVRIETDNNVVISFAQPRITLRYAGGGITALVPDVRLASPEKYQVAAVLAYHHAHGRAVEPLLESRRQKPPTLQQEASADSRRRLRAAVVRLVVDSARLGASHLSSGMLQRYETVAVWAQGAEYHRLARLLRGLADQVELLLERNARADEGAFVDGCAVVLALTSALEAAAEAGDEPTRLVGRARTTYDRVPSLEVVGLGGMPWQSGSGYHGLTCLFWWPAEARFVSWTDARPDTVAGFDPRARWLQEPPWPGLASPAATAGRALRLTDARLSASGRLSGVESTHAQVTDATDLLDVPATTHWSELDGLRSRRSLLEEPDPLREWAVLEPTAFEPAVFDASRQVVLRGVRDVDGELLVLALRWTPQNAQAAHLLETLDRDALPTGTRVVARVRRGPGAPVAEPLSVITGPAELRVLHFDTGDAGTAHPGGATSTPGMSADLRPAALRELGDWTLRQLERGTGTAAAGLSNAALARRHRALRDVGLTVFPDVPAGADPARALLQSRYLALQVSELLA